MLLLQCSGGFSEGQTIKAFKKKSETKPVSLTFHLSACLCVYASFFHHSDWNQWSVWIEKHRHTNSVVGGLNFTLMWNFVMLFVFALKFPFSSSALFNSPCQWSSSRISPLVMSLPYCSVCVCVLSMCECIFVCSTWVCYKEQGIMYVTLLYVWGSEWMSETVIVSVYTEVAKTFPSYLHEESYEK